MGSSVVTLGMGELFLVIMMVLSRFKGATGVTVHVGFRAFVDVTSGHSLM